MVCKIIELIAYVGQHTTHNSERIGVTQERLLAHKTYIEVA